MTEDLFQLGRPTKGARIVVAMSGGVDSSVVAALAARSGAELHKAADPARDQSYFLFATTRDQLEFLRFPLGDMPKPAGREIAR